MVVLKLFILMMSMSDGWDLQSLNRVPVPDYSIDPLFTQQSQQPKRKNAAVANASADKRNSSKSTQRKQAQMRRDTVDVSLLI